MNTFTIASLVSVFLATSLSLSSCGVREPKPTPSPSVSSSPVASTSPGIPSKYKYTLPVIVRAEPECGEASQLLYQVSLDGSIRYYPGDYLMNGFDPNLTMQKRQLSDPEVVAFEKILAEVDLAKQFESSSKVPDDAPQTMECRTVMTFTMDVNGSPQTYDANGRKFSHTQAYRDSTEKLQTYLKGLTPASSTNPHYGLALKSYQYDECGDSQTLEYEISATGVLKSLKAGTENNPEYTTRNLARLEIKELDDLLTQLNLFEKFKQQTVIPAGSPQTEECRFIHKLELDVDGSMQTIEGRRSRSITPSSDYLAAIDQLNAKLKELAGR